MVAATGNVTILPQITAAFMRIDAFSRSIDRFGAVAAHILLVLVLQAGASTFPVQKHEVDDFLHSVSAKERDNVSGRCGEKLSFGTVYRYRKVVKDGKRQDGKGLYPWPHFTCCARAAERPAPSAHRALLFVGSNFEAVRWLNAKPARRFEKPSHLTAFLTDGLIHFDPLFIFFP